VTDVSIALLADRPDLVEGIGRMRFDEWGRPPEPDDPQWWVDVTGREAGRIGLPVTFVAHDAAGAPLGAVGIGEFDPDEYRDRSPWVLGMVVRPDQRRRGIGRRLVASLDPYAAGLGYDRIWVATGPPAKLFYEHCGYRLIENFRDSYGWDSHILCKQL